MRISLLLFSALVGFFSLPAVAQNGWTKKKKELYAQLQLTTFHSTNYWNVQHIKFNGGSRFNSNALILYGEYGLTDRLTATLNSPVLMSRNYSSTSTVAGVGGVRLGLKYGIVKKLPISIQFEADIPTDDGINYAVSKEPNALGTFDLINLATSDGEFNFWTTLAVSKSNRSGQLFGSLYGSFNLRTKGYGNQLQAGGEFGGLLWKKLYVIGKFKVQQNASSSALTTASIVYGEGTTFSAYNLTAILKLKKGWMLLSSFNDIIPGPVKQRNVYDGFSFSFGFAFNRVFNKASKETEKKAN